MGTGVFARRRLEERLVGLGGDQGDVVVLLVGTVGANFVDDGGDQLARRQGVVTAEGGDEAGLAEFLEVGVEGFGDTVGIEDESVAGEEKGFADFAIPVVECAEDSGRGVEGLDGGIGAEDEPAEVATVGVAEAARGVIVFGEEESGEGAVWRVFAEELIDGTKEAVRVVSMNGALAAEIGLEVGHEERGGDALAGDVANDKTEASVAEAEEVVIITADLAGLMTDAGVIEGSEFRKSLREKA